MKREWPKNWESFVGEIVGASRTNESLCQNNMTILKLLSEEVFDFSAGNMTQMKAKHLKDTMCSEFAKIFELCQFVLVSLNIFDYFIKIQYFLTLILVYFVGIFPKCCFSKCNFRYTIKIS